MEQEELDKIMEDHKEWLLNNDKGKRASLMAADLRGVDLSGVDLSGADLRGVNLANVDLKTIGLRGADLRGATLKGADLSDANLSWAVLGGADLSDVNLRGVDLSDVDLSNVYLRGADLTDVNLKFSKLNWDSHNLIGRVLIIHSNNNPNRLKIARFFSLASSLCWEDFINELKDDPDFDWAVETLNIYEGCPIDNYLIKEEGKNNGNV